MNVSIVIPAYNEEVRLVQTVRMYHTFFINDPRVCDMNVEFILVPNGCTDNTISIAQHLANELSNVRVLCAHGKGKGLAITEGFLDALSRDNDYIGFVDADAATKPEYFFELIAKLNSYDGVIASRYMPESKTIPKRPRVKRWGSRFIYEPLVWATLGLSYYDLQCGAKIFKRHVIYTIIQKLTITQWAFDIELLHLCKKYGFTIKEVPTVWHDQHFSKLTLYDGFKMLSAIFDIRNKHGNE